MFIDSLIILLAYLFGSTTSAVIICYVMRLSDPRVSGSKNPGVTNVLRLHGKAPAFLTLLGDVLKGLAPVYIAYGLGRSDLVIALAGCLAVIGHAFPIFFKFRGGKGIATFVGVLIAFHWVLGLGYILTWLLSALLSRYSSVAGLFSAFMTPIYTWLLLGDLVFVIANVFIALIIFWRHKNNIKNLFNGTESKLRFL